MFSNIFESVPSEIRKTPLNRVVKFMNVYGCVVYSDQRYKFLHFLRGILFTITLVALNCLQLYAIQPKYWRTIGDMSLGTATAIVYLASNCQLIRIFFFHRDFVQLFKYIAKDAPRFYLSNGAVEQSLYKQYSFVSRCVFLGMYLPTTFTFILIAGSLVASSISIFGEYGVDSIFDPENRPFLLSMYPLSNFSRNIIIGYLGPFFAISVGVLFIPTWHVGMGIMLLYPVYVFKLIKKKLENLENDTSGNLNEILISLVRLQIQTKAFIKRVESFISILVFIDFLLFSVLFCFLLYQFSESGSEDTFKMLLLFMYFFLASFMQFVYHLVANEISYQANSVSTSFYLSSWYNFPVLAQKSGLTLMIGSSRAMVLQAVFINMNLTTFLSILRASYGYFTMMRNINRKD